MSEIANSEPATEQDLTIAEISAFAESQPTVAHILGWLSSRCHSYVYLAGPDGQPVLHAGQERPGEVVIAAIPGEDLALSAVGGVGLETLAQVALITSTALARQRAEVLAEAKSHGDLLRSLIAGDEAAIERALAEGWDLDREVFMIVGRFAAQVDVLTEEWRRIIRLRDPKSLIVFFPQEIVAVLSRESVDRRTFVEALPRESGDVAFSRIGNGRHDLGTLYEQCDVAITVAKNIGHVGSVSALDDLGAYRLLALIQDSSDLRLFLNDTLKDLATRTDLEAVDLRRTLQVLLDHNLNVAEAARSLHFHYNTLRYRLNKLTKVLGDFTTDPELRLSISLALRILSLRGL